MAPPPAGPAGRALIGQAAADGRRGARRAARRAVGRRGAGRTSAWVSEGSRPRAGAGRPWSRRRRREERVRVSGLRRSGRAGTGLREAHVPPRPRPGPGWGVAALGRRECRRPREGRAPVGLERGLRSRARESGVLASLGDRRIPSARARNLVPAWPQVRGPVSPQRSRSAPSDCLRRPGSQPGLLSALSVSGGPGGEAKDPPCSSETRRPSGASQS